jgi:hypothetical protein
MPQQNDADDYAGLQEADDGPDDNSGCYECGGRGWIVRCIDDLCHGQDECIHGDPPDPCRTCNPKGEKEDSFL